jgi:O-antigen ligase
MNVAGQSKLKPVEAKPEGFGKVFALLFGLLLGLALVKFGNVVVMEKFVTVPANIYELIFNGWPLVWGYWMLAGVTVVGLMVARWRVRVPKVVVFLPLAWLVWQVVAATRTVDGELTKATVIHFATCAICFYLGLFSLSQVGRNCWFWVGIIGGFVWVLIVGFQQHFGGLEETRRYFFTYIYPTETTLPPDFLKKISSNRIFSTLFYPNALAGVILLLLPPVLAVIWSMKERLTVGARVLLMGIIGVGAVGCLYWSGSKGGWLIAMAMVLVATLMLQLKRQWKVMVIGAVLVVGLTGFALKYYGFFKKGATSVTARGDYWRAAVQTVGQNPVFGTGPGTFAKAYEKVKKPESEMARLTHNDYLQQASDSGVMGALLYISFVGSGLFFAFRRNFIQVDVVKAGVWLGLLGWAIQGLAEFGLYIPAIAWSAFGLLGWLLGTARNGIDSEAKER